MTTSTTKTKNPRYRGQVKTIVHPTVAGLEKGQVFQLVYPGGHKTARRTVLERKNSQDGNRTWLWVEVMGSKRREIGVFDPYHEVEVCQ